MSQRLSGHTLLVSLLATPIRHSLSPKMHNEAYVKLGLDYAYLAFEVGTEQLANAVKGFVPWVSVVPMSLCQIKKPLCPY